MQDHQTHRGGSTCHCFGRDEEAHIPLWFRNYWAEKNSCQCFILAILESNRLAYPYIIAMSEQDFDDISNRLSCHTNTMARALTDVADAGIKAAEDVQLNIRGQ
mmetsp:Transcript_36693/g.79203  ORF Transcript_36693/g.79203 Transcript_36693/m.79203 type:complete len:104 (+) Transcript_36693:1870-2181(+)